MINFDLTNKTLPPYIFADLDRLKEEARKNNQDIIDFSMGNPDLAPPEHVIEKISELTKNPNLYGYSVSGGIKDLKKALCDYYLRRFNVNIDPENESLVTVGAKEGLTSFANVLSEKGRAIIVPNPSYPIHTFAFIIARSKAVSIESSHPEEFLKKFKNYVETADIKPSAVLVNFPCNPTAHDVGLDFYQELVDFCLKHQIYIISDIAYCEIYFNENRKPHSILEVKRAKEIAIEFSSTSKSYSMAGCRVGFAAGNKNLILNLRKIKSYLDYGSFLPIQMAAIEALSEKSDPYLKKIRKIYHKRALFLIDQFKTQLGWNIEMPDSTMFLWTKIPEKFNPHRNSFEFCRYLIEKEGVALSPGSAFGSAGEGHVRISLIRNDSDVIEAVSRIKRLFS